MYCQSIVMTAHIILYKGSIIIIIIITIQYNTIYKGSIIFQLSIIIQRSIIIQISVIIQISTMRTKRVL